MCVAAYFGLQKVIEFPGCEDINVESVIGRQPIHYAARGGQIDMIEFLAARGANLDAQDKYGFSPLHLASEIGQAEAVRTLLQSGATPDSRTYRDRCAPLHWAAKYGHLETTRALVDAGASVDCRDFAGNTPLHLAWYYDRKLVVSFLTEKRLHMKGSSHQGEDPMAVKCDVWKV
jgi:ankyrin